MAFLFRRISKKPLFFVFCGFCSRKKKTSNRCLYRGHYLFTKPFDTWNFVPNFEISPFQWISAEACVNHLKTKNLNHQWDIANNWEKLFERNERKVFSVLSLTSKYLYTCVTCLTKCAQRLSSSTVKVYPLDANMGLSFSKCFVLLEDCFHLSCFIMLNSVHNKRSFDG